MSKQARVEAWLWDDETGTLYPIVRIPEGITQEMVHAVRHMRAISPDEFAAREQAADILQALLDAGGDDE